jgi:hypothetical protein
MSSDSAKHDRVTAEPPDPDPRETPDLEPGGGVSPGSTPPASGQTSGLSHPQPIPSKVGPVIWLVVIGVLALMVAGLVVAMAIGWLRA